jgi:hypothetical protein
MALGPSVNLTRRQNKRSLNSLGLSPFARHYSGNIFRRSGHFFLFLRLLRCFNSPGCPLTSLCVQLAGAPSSTGQVYPFGNLRFKGCLPPHRSLSQAATSFIVFLCQGIHHIPLLRFSHVFDLKTFLCFINCVMKHGTHSYISMNYFWLMLYCFCNIWFVRYVAEYSIVNVHADYDYRSHNLQPLIYNLYFVILPRVISYGL